LREVTVFEFLTTCRRYYKPFPITMQTAVIEWFKDHVTDYAMMFAYLHEMVVGDELTFADLKEAYERTEERIAIMTDGAKKD
jgi:hypothetical protein